MRPRPNVHQVVPYLTTCLPLDLIPELDVLEEEGLGEVQVAGLMVRCPGAESSGWGIHVLQEDGSAPLVGWSWDVAEIAEAASRMICDWRRVGRLEDLRRHQDHLLVKALRGRGRIPYATEERGP